jgi:hypothetical protein
MTIPAADDYQKLDWGAKCEHQGTSYSLHAFGPHPNGKDNVYLVRVDYDALKVEATVWRHGTPVPADSEAFALAGKSDADVVTALDEARAYLEAINRRYWENDQT